MQMEMMFDAEDGRFLRDAAVEKVKERSEDMARALRAVYEAADGQPELTTDDVIRLLDRPLDEPRVLGAAMREAQREKWVVPRTYWRQSDYAVCHARPKRVWMSLICRQTAPTGKGVPA